jgi:hypothetical protein
MKRRCSMPGPGPTVLLLAGMVLVGCDDNEWFDVSITAEDGVAQFAWDAGDVHRFEIDHCDSGDCSDCSGDGSVWIVRQEGGSDTWRRTPPVIASPVIYGVTPSGSVDANLPDALTRGDAYVVKLTRWEQCTDDPGECGTEAKACVDFVW